MQNVIAILVSILLGISGAIVPPRETGDLAANRTSTGAYFENENSVWWADVFDESKLCRYNKDSGELTVVSDELVGVSCISEYDGDIYFTALSLKGEYLDEADSVYSSGIYHVDASANADDIEPELFIADASGALFYDGYVYYHNTADVALHAESIYRMSLADGKLEKLVDSKGHEWLDMTISVADGCLYLADLVDLYACDLETLELTNLTGGRFAPDGGINKPQYRDGAVYFYTYQYNDNAAIYRYVVETGEIEQVLLLNGGDFWCDVLLVDEDRIIFNGRQASQPAEGEQRARGLYEFDLVTGTITLITSDSTGPTCYLAGDNIVSVSVGAERSVTVYTETDNGWYSVTVKQA